MAGTAELVAISLLGGRRIASVLRTGLVAAAFAAVVFLPSALAGNWVGAGIVTAKVLLSSVAAMLVAAASGWTSIARGLSALRLSDTFILVLDLAVRYVSLLGGLVLDMLHALKLRSVGRNDDKAASLAGIAGTTFLKSREAADELLAAMECRCFSGEYRIGKLRGPKAPDLAFVACALLLVLAFVYFQGAAG